MFLLLAAPLAAAHTEEFLNWKTLRDRGVIKQSLDYSCGLAALATILTYHFRDPVGEADLLAMLKQDPAMSKNTIDWEREGVSFAILRQLAEARGYQVVGVRVEIEALNALQIPAIAALEHQGMTHFTVLRGVDASDYRYRLADPSWGNARLQRHDFAARWRDPITGQGKLLLLFRDERSSLSP